MYKDCRIDVCIILCFNVSLHCVWFIFRIAERTFTTAEYTFPIAERRYRTAEHNTITSNMEMSTGNAKE